jgi:hypothetical protein
MVVKPSAILTEEERCIEMSFEGRNAHFDMHRPAILLKRLSLIIANTFVYRASL